MYGNSKPKAAADDEFNIAPAKVVRVLVVDDQAAIRQMLTKLLSQAPDIEVVDTATDAQDARQKIKHYDPDVVTLDIEMPGMDGLSFLEKIMRLRPMPVVMCSTLTNRGAKVTLKALELGAVDFIAKPRFDLEDEVKQYAQDIIEKVRSAATAHVQGLDSSSPVSAGPTIAIEQTVSRPRLVAIGCSTGGTVALEKILTKLPKNSPPIVVAQHIPEGFSAAFAERVNATVEVEVKEAEDGDAILPGRVLIAPGGLHLKVRKQAGMLVAQLDSGDKVNWHRPSVDVLFDSVISEVGSHAVGVILTGMGKDGAKGMKRMSDAGIYTIAQDEASSLVWGMPKQAIDLGGVSEVISLESIAEKFLTKALT